MIQATTLSYFRRNKLLLIALALIAVYAFALFCRVPPVKGQASQSDEAEALFRQSAGTHSAKLATAYFDRTTDHAPDPLTKTERHLKEKRLSGFFRNISDPGEFVAGRVHDSYTQIIDVANPPGPIPTAYAKAIITARLTSAHAFAAEDKQSVYTEYYFSALKIFKSDDGRLQSGSQVIATRVGGSVVFPSGHQRDYIRDGEGVPKVDSEYILFLWRPTKTTLDYGICAIYEVLEGKLYALDPVRPYTDYEGKSADAFLVQVEDSLSAAGGR